MVGAAGFGAAATGVAANGKAPPRPSEERSVKRWSGRPDSNRRRPAPKAGALPGCATPRLVKNTLKNAPNRHDALRRRAGVALRVAPSTAPSGEGRRIWRALAM